jgi:5-formyltetrahydrofolate cyclo-ligase
MEEGPGARKRALRNLVRDRMTALGAVAHDLSAAAQAGLLKSGLLDSARCVALYRALPGELATGLLEETLRARGVRVLLPRVHPDRLRRELDLCASDEELVRSAFGIDEPHPEQPPISLQEIDAFLIPGLAFDERGGRLGHGRGHYDATIAANARALRIGFFRDEAGIDEVPTEPHDQRLDWIATPSRIIACPPRTKAR